MQLEDKSVKETLKKLKEQNELDYAELIKLFGKASPTTPTILDEHSDS